MSDDDVGVSVVAVMRYIVFFSGEMLCPKGSLSGRLVVRVSMVLELWGIQSESVAYTLHGNFEAQPTDGDFKKYESQV